MHRPLLLFSALLITLALTAQVQVNRSSKPQVSERGISGRNLLSKEVVIPEIDLPQVLEKWKLQGHPKFAEPVRTDITPLRASQREENGKYVVYRMKITARKAHSITIYFDRLKLSQNAELYLYNPAGTIVTGPITYKENIAPGRTWGSNVFDGETVIVELKTPANEQSQNDLHIYQVLYGIHDSIEWADTDSAAFPGFGTAGNCNVNVICDASWANERNAVARVTASNGGMFSGALVMNTCGSARPFLLTAYHCIVNNDVVIDQSGSTFEFLWISPTCTPTTNTSSTLLFNGAVVRSKWSETDFALLELNQQIPSGSSLYFLGWDRSSTAPAASVGIHHPNGDIMKISKEHQTATVGNIGFYSNTAWRVVWDAGATQDGSSGSPLFDASSHRVVGQLYSGTQPSTSPCLHTGGSNYGRFDLSWAGGGTNDTRLSNWLDPNNTNAMTTTTTNVSNLIPASLLMSISGNLTICQNGSSETYTLLGAPAGAPITWSISNTNIASLSPNGNQATVTKIGDGTVTLTAQAAPGCGLANSTVSINIRLGARTSSDYNLTANSSLNQPLYWCTGGTYAFSVDGPGSNYQWTYPSGFTINYQSNYLLVLNAPSSPSPPTGTVTVTFTEPCGGTITKSFLIVYSSANCGATDPRFTFSPNPAPSYLYVAVAPSYVGSVTIRRIQVVQVNSGVTYLDQSYGPPGISSTYVSVSGFPAGNYTLRIYDGSTWSNYPFVH